jgi:hypothetical protein
MFDQDIRTYLSQPRSTLLAGRGHSLEAACLEISLANERFVTERLRRLHLNLLLKRTDRMLGALEELNLMNVPHIPEASRLQIAVLVADLPFEYSVFIGDPSTPTQAIDLVFDLQEALLVFMTGLKRDDDELQEAAS